MLAHPTNKYERKKIAEKKRKRKGFVEQDLGSYEQEQLALSGRGISSSSSLD